MFADIDGQTCSLQRETMQLMPTGAGVRSTAGPSGDSYRKNGYTCVF